MELNTPNLIGILASLLSGGSLSAYIFERRKNKALAKSAEADADGKKIQNRIQETELYQKLIDDLALRYKKKYQEIETMYERKCRVLEEEIVQLESSYQRKIELLESEIRLKNATIKELIKENKELKNGSKSTQ
ncbi:conserved hypothetical protein [Tenacibaculum sp. 190524A02b]|uniref:Uncharacterized protein n=1 Tax=Tenacibaculum vairaonense TaxID=3137860 RepID=A0ABM9PQW2_9FLAO